MLYVSLAQEEHCRRDKDRIRMVCHITAVHFILSGRGYFNGKLLTAGDGFITRSGDLMDYVQDPGDPWTYLWIRFGGTDTEHLWESTVFPAGSGAFTCGLPQGFTDVFRPFLYSGDGDYIGDRMRGEALAKLFCSFFQKPGGKHDSGRQYVEYAKRQMTDNIHLPVTVEELAARQHISRKYLSALFDRYEGVSPKQYLTRLRLERAEVLLASTAYPVTDIAGSVGYPDVLAFSRFFRTHTGMSPTEYRAGKQHPQNR